MLRVIDAYNGSRATRMKMRTKHIVPLSPQALRILRNLHPLTGRGWYAALRRMGYEQGTVTVHGFRATACTLLNETWHIRSRPPTPSFWHDGRCPLDSGLRHGKGDYARNQSHCKHCPER